MSDDWTTVIYKKKTSYKAAGKPIDFHNVRRQNGLDFSVNNKQEVRIGCVHPIRVACKSYDLPKAVNLLEGYEKYTVPKYSSCLLLLMSMMLHYPKVTPLMEAFAGIRFVCNRRVLRLLAKVPYGARFDEEWEMVVERYGQLLGIKVLHQKDRFEVNETQCYIGGNLPVLLDVSESKGDNPPGARVVPQEWQYYVVNHIQRDTGKILYSAEIDSISNNDDELVEIKAFKWPMPSPLKSFDWWLQNSLGGVEHTLVGVHKDGMLEKIRLLSNASLLRKCEKKFNVKKVQQHLENILSKIEKKADDIGPAQQLRLHWKSTDIEYSYRNISESDRVFSNEFKARFPIAPNTEETQ